MSQVSLVRPVEAVFTWATWDRQEVGLQSDSKTLCAGVETCGHCAKVKPLSLMTQLGNIVFSLGTLFYYFFFFFIRRVNNTMCVIIATTVVM